MMNIDSSEEWKGAHTKLVLECSKHGVYDKSKSPVPLVVYPEGCIDQCHGCQNKCPVNAISYVGDTNGSMPQSSCDCGGNCCS